MHTFLVIKRIVTNISYYQVSPQVQHLLPNMLSETMEDTMYSGFMRYKAQSLLDIQNQLILRS